MASSKSKPAAAAAGVRAGTIKAKNHSVQSLTLNVPIDEARAAQIQKCLKKGTLKISFDQVDLTTGRLGDGWLYD